MFSSLLAPALALALVAPANGAPAGGDSPAEAAPVATHTLTLQRGTDGCLFVDGVDQSAAGSLDLRDCNVAVRGSEGGAFSTVTLPDGRVFYKGDFVLRAQSLDSGTVEVEVCHGEAVVAPADLAPFSAVAKPRGLGGADGPA